MQGVTSAWIGHCSEQPGGVKTQFIPWRYRVQCFHLHPPWWLSQPCPGSLYLFNAPFGPEAPPAALGFDDLGVGVEPLGEALVLAALPGRAHLGVALVLQHPVEALRLQPARVLIRRLAVTPGNLRQVGHLDLNLPDHLVGLGSKGGEQRMKTMHWEHRVNNWHEKAKKKKLFYPVFYGTIQ